MRAFRFFGGCPGVNTRAWLFGIVRNTCYAWLLSNRRQQPTIEFDESLFRPHYAVPNPEETLLHHDTRSLIGLALEGLPSKFREVLILRELEGLSGQAGPSGSLVQFHEALRPSTVPRRTKPRRAAAGCRVEPARSLYLQTMPIRTGGGRWRGEQPSTVANAVNRSLQTTVFPALRLQGKKLTSSFTAGFAPAIVGTAT